MCFHLCDAKDASPVSMVIMHLWCVGFRRHLEESAGKIYERPFSPIGVFLCFGLGKASWRVQQSTGN